ncbi:MAG: GNAT family N-acetyltransferase [Gammaproteobacteria bacterium]|nr:GNAT family N-acetyltransferase [Gammaproteobacteria bacterium]MBU2059245.1 GNAT family N-acetyltransferase [Gammaproteobacteria bacterium]MBU2176783.1 GNAT family N-acetyltransferase [Gammaproteobacteria bacterium]MBU2246640.1 GNAT family N-acetyltransferase [Gammaproteobacteria bacterium]MBU2344408.1 GNAT family N-acetyltransferase [Gammaproteobacteria bacterium]
MTNLLQIIRQQQSAYQERGWRLPIWLAGSEAYTQQQLSALKPEGKSYWLGHEAPAGFTLLSAKQKQQWLGTECDLLVVDARHSVDWDLVAASSGCLKAGGLWLFVTETPDIWRQQPNPAAKRVLPYPLDAAIYTGLFKQFWLEQLSEQRWVKLIEGNSAVIPLLPEVMVSSKAEHPFRTTEQQHAVAAIYKVVTGHRRRPLVLTAHRGRGKSSALGLAAAQLAQQGKTDILLTGPSPVAVQTAFFIAANLLNEPYQPGQNQLLKGVIRFVPVDVLLAEKQQNTVILVDEAAAIPTPQLQQLADLYSRLVFATTEHGYEGTGRGFQLRFQSYLQQHCPGFQKLHLHQPIRYQANDPLEQLIFKGFLLEQTDSGVTALQQPKVVSYPVKELLLQPQKLQQIFSLLSLAHYQTDVMDLWALLDNPALKIYTLEQAKQVIACALISFEGELDQELALAVAHGKRRVQGHLLAQSLAFHCLQPQLAEQKMARIQRIVVHPSVQIQGLGSQLLGFVLQDLLSQQYLIGTSFGATLALVKFWQKAGFSPVKLSHQNEQASNEASVLMLYGEQFRPLQQQFSRQLYWQLADKQRILDPALALLWAEPPSIDITSLQNTELELFQAGLRPYELIETHLLCWFNINHAKVEHQTALLLVQRLWQKQDWQQVSLASAKQKLPELCRLLKFLG